MEPATQFLNNLGENITLLIILALLHSRLTAHLHAAKPWVRSVANGLLFAAVAIVGMLVPIHLAKGIFFDGRPVIVLAAAVFDGPIGGITAAIVVGVLRLYLGGAGALPGLGGIITALAIGIIFSAPFGAGSWRRRLLMGGLVGVSSLAWTLALPAEIAPVVMREMAVPLLLYYPLGFLLFTAVVSYEQHQHERERALERSERRFRAIFNSTFQLIGLLAPDGTVLQANRTALDFAGVSESDIVGKKLWETPFCPAEPRARRGLRAAIRRAASGHFVRFEAATGGFRRGAAFVDFSLQPVRDQTGRVVMLLPEGRDITERKRAERRLLKAEERLRQAQKMEAVGQLTGGIAHDFNNLLTVVGGNLELLARREFPDGDRRLIDAAMRGVSRGATLTQQLLAFSRKQRLTPEVVEVNRAVLDTATMLQRLLGEAVAIRTELADDLQPGYFDPHQLETALLNLAINARDAMPAGGVLTIRTENAPLPAEVEAGDREKSGAYVLLSVSDTGFGMADDVLRRAVEPFFTTKEVGRGSGLGLSMVYGFVKQSGGQIDIASAPGEGTVVRLYLPASTVAKALPAEMAPTSRLPGQLEARETVLVVEDQADVRSVAATLLQDLGYTVRQAADGIKALETLREDDSIDLIFTDLVMPQMDGAALADEARRLRPGIRVLFTSGHSEGHDRVAAHADADFIAKPFQRADLADKVRGLLDRPAPVRVASAG